MKLSVPVGLAVLALLLVSAHSNPQNYHTNYTYTFDNLFRFQGGYSLGYIDKAYTVMVNLTRTSNGAGIVDFTAAPLPFTVILVPSNAAAGTPNASNTCVVYTNAAYSTTSTNVVLTCPTTGASDYYLLKISLANYPTKDDGTDAKTFEYFQLTATSYLTASTDPTNSDAIIKPLLQVTDTFRDRVSKLIYLNQT